MFKYYREMRKNKQREKFELLFSEFSEKIYQEVLLQIDRDKVDSQFFSGVNFPGHNLHDAVLFFRNAIIATIEYNKKRNKK